MEEIFQGDGAVGRGRRSGRRAWAEVGVAPPQGRMVTWTEGGCEVVIERSGGGGARGR